MNPKSVDSGAVELAPVRDVLQLYCRGLSERSVEIQDVRLLVEKNIGWLDDSVATTDGATIFVPAIIERFNRQAENFELLKIVLTQQAGHIEFGSFGFEFKRPATQFGDIRPKIATPPDYHDHDHGHEGHHERPQITEYSRFFKLFPARRLAGDIFSILEAGRIEARVMHDYPGIAPAYRKLRRETLDRRPKITLLPEREALLEALVRLTLGQMHRFEVPEMHCDAVREFRLIVQRLARLDATVEDAAEGTLRVYSRLARVENDSLKLSKFIPFPPVDSFSDPALISFEMAAAAAGEFSLPRATGRERDYLSPQAVYYRGEFRPELGQLLSGPESNSREQRKALTAEELADLLRSQRTPKQRDSDGQEREQDLRTSQMVQNLLRELERRDPRMQKVARPPDARADDDAGPLAATQPNTFVYDEWDAFEKRFRQSWCKVHEKTMLPAGGDFYRETVLARRGLMRHIRAEFEQVAPELYRKLKRLPDGVEHDLDAAIESVTELRAGKMPSEKIFWRPHKIDRDVTVAFLLDLSGSTGESIGRFAALPANAPAGEGVPRRIIDVEKEAIVLMSDALETIGDRYGVYGFSGHGRENVEFYIIKEMDESFGPEVAQRFDRISPLHATRMGPAIRHATMKLGQQQSRSKFLFLISDGRPQDRGYSQESSAKGYAIQDTRMALAESRREGITAFCLTVDREGNDYLRAMMGDFAYEVLPDVSLLPLRLPQLYKKLTM